MNSDEKLVKNPPPAEVLMNSMRAMGYSFESAIADIIDNSISANGKNIQINFPIDPSYCFVSIIDDGEGMTKHELFDAMKYGSEAKVDGRKETDLGRFGLGLKSASISQCRKLTVISKKNGIISGYVWDLDIVERKKDWFVKELPISEINNISQATFLKDKSSGTLVLWEHFDFIEKSKVPVFSALSKYKEKVSDYLSLIFHRFLNKTGNKKISIKINNFPLQGLDPFLENHNKTNKRMEIKIPIKDCNGEEREVTIQPYVLPYIKDLSEEDQRLSGGLKNYRSKQGFYIYRNERLIDWGKWYGRDKEELTKYARIKVDIPNTLDDIWGIDIKKQNATIPLFIKQNLNEAIDDVLDKSIKIENFRGRIQRDSETKQRVWEILKNRNQVNFIINKKHKLIEQIKQTVDDETWIKISDLLKAIEITIPYQDIYLGVSQNQIDKKCSEKQLDELVEQVEIQIDLDLRLGESSNREEAIKKILTIEPYCNYSEEIRHKLR